jgi:hypothetical protein
MCMCLIDHVLLDHVYVFDHVCSIICNPWMATDESKTGDLMGNASAGVHRRSGSVHGLFLLGEPFS